MQSSIFGVNRTQTLKIGVTSFQLKHDFNCKPPIQLKKRPKSIDFINKIDKNDQNPIELTPNQSIGGPIAIGTPNQSIGGGSQGAPRGAPQAAPGDPQLGVPPPDCQLPGWAILKGILCTLWVTDLQNSPKGGVRGAPRGAPGGPPIAIPIVWT